MKLRLFLATWLFVPIALVQPSRAQTWQLPPVLDDTNTSIAFEVDSTWHVVHGKSSGVHGNIRYGNSTDPNSLQGEISVPVVSFDTDNSRRDSKLREVMAAKAFPEVRYRITGAHVDCTHPQSSEGFCSATLEGDLSIRGQMRRWTLPGTIDANHGLFHFRAEGHLRWPEFGVEDPSIFIAKLDPNVKVLIDVRWKTEAGEN